MRSNGPLKVAITGLGMVTPLGNSPAEVFRRIQAGESAAAPPTHFDASAFSCPVCAQVKDFDPQRYVSESKMVRLMNRDAQFAVAAARLALKDAEVEPGKTYQPEEIALFGATGLAGLPLREVTPLVRVSAGLDGTFDLTRFGQAGLRAVSPILSFKILSNMPFCFVSINENIQGPNAIYTPWEGEGAQAVEAGLRALQAGDARCALVGGCDVKTHELAFASLQQQGLFDCWNGAPASRGQSPVFAPRTPTKTCGTDPAPHGAPASLPASPNEVEKSAKHAHSLSDGADRPSGVVPGEGAAFLVLESEEAAATRGAHIYGYLTAFNLRPHCHGKDLTQTRADVLSRLKIRDAKVLVSSADGNALQDQQESSYLEAGGISPEEVLCPKKHVGNLFAAAALVQIVLGAALTEAGATSVLANCFGHGSTQAAFVLSRQGCRNSQA